MTFLDPIKYPRQCASCHRQIPLSEQAVIRRRATSYASGELLCSRCGEYHQTGPEFVGSGVRIVRNTHGLGG
jgi:recombinational DNA repair protein (RecF pathway)